jgi:Family of unknown function (DUF6519)
MNGDISRVTFDPHKHYSSVFMQQGRVQIDSDFNKQAAIVLHYMRTLATDIMGPHAGPSGPSRLQNFGIELQPDGNGNPDLVIGRGRYYVDGILCENDPEEADEGNEVGLRYSEQPNYPLPTEEVRLPDPPYLVYLDVWERYKTALEDPVIRETALGGPDTATRTEVVWQVKVTDEKPGASNFPTDKRGVEDAWESWVERWQSKNRGNLKARAKGAANRNGDPCVVSPEASYRRPENQLYRVEIHRSGQAGQRNGDSVSPAVQQVATAGDNAGAFATFKWARDNCTAVFPIRELHGNTVTLENLGRNRRLSLSVGELVEVVNDRYVLQGRAEPLPRVVEIDETNMRVVLSGEPSSDIQQNPDRHPLLRRWDHGASDSKNGKMEEGTLPLQEDHWLTLEDGVQVRFEPTAEGDVRPRYRSGDCWLIPARTATGDVEWPGKEGKPEAQPPHGTEHHYAPLAMVVPGQDEPVDCRCLFEPLCIPASR